ncbi:hypothetical protein LJC36_01050 [Desulfovibrio sp. OttesenSCG-928-C14]|nr:hypothetical protein [Desulfovibrio sp. OttesenSCG-928-C14]
MKAFSNELVAYIGGAYAETLEDGSKLIANFDITPNIEKMYIEDSSSKKDKQNRVKLLAWVMARGAYSLIERALKENSAALSLVGTGLLFRSMLQFSVGKVIEDGLAMQRGRKKPSTRDKTGYRALKAKYKEG